MEEEKSCEQRFLREGAGALEEKIEGKRTDCKEASQDIGVGHRAVASREERGSVFEVEKFSDPKIRERAVD